MGLKEKIKSKSGKDKTLYIYVEPGKLDKAAWSMDCLKRAIHWDEKRFGLELEGHATVLVKHQILVDIAKGIAPRRVAKQIILAGVNRDGPEGLGLRNLVWSKMQNIAALAAIEFLAIAIMVRAQLDHFLDVMF